MARTPSTMLELGTAAAPFSLPNWNGKDTVALKDYSGKPILIMFICNHCPFVKHVRSELAAIGVLGEKIGVAVVAINSNDVATHPEDSPEKMRLEAQEAGYTFPYLFDETQAVARAYQAACTPDFFLFDASHRLAYRGQLDDSRPGNGQPVTGRDLRAAMEAVAKAQRPSAEQKPSLGCNIKWKD